MLIGEVARHFKIEPSAIRYYEEIGLLPKAEKINKRRHYENDVLMRLKLIRAAQSMGFKIQEIKILMKGFDPKLKRGGEWRPLAERKLKELDQLIQRAQGMKKLLGNSMNCKCLQWQDCEIIK